MSESMTVTLTLLAILIPVIGGLFYIIYSNIKDRIDAANDTFDSFRREAWSEINALRERSHVIDTTHQTLCQKHEDEMNDHREDIEQHKLDISRLLTLHMETKKEYDGRIHAIEISIRAIAQQQTR